jgi:nitroreductase
MNGPTIRTARDSGTRAGRDAPLDPASLRLVLNAGVHAPSVHNTQPWQFVLTAEGIEVRADRSRQLHRLDPAGREMFISCGAAILNMRVRAAATGHPVRVSLLPDAGDPDHCATLIFKRFAPAPVDDAVLSAALGRRHTHRRSFRADPIGDATVAHLAAAAVRESAELVVVAPEDRDAVARLVRIASRVLDEDATYRLELRAWTTSASHPAQGVPGTAFGTRPTASGPPVRDFTVAMPWVQRAQQHFQDELWLVITTERDDPAGWIAAGQALERLWLTATAAGLAASFLNQVLEVPPLRRELRDYLGVVGYPQAVLRAGAANPSFGAGRRPLDEMVTVELGAAELFIDQPADDPPTEGC